MWCSSLKWHFWICQGSAAVHSPSKVITMQNEYDSHGLKQKKKISRSRCLEPGMQGIGMNILFPEGSYLTGVTFSSPVPPPGYSSPEQWLQPGVWATSLKGRDLPLKPGLLRLKLKPQQRSLWSKKHTRSSRARESNSPHHRCKAISSFPLRAERNGQVGGGYEKHKPTPTLTCPPDPSLTIHHREAALPGAKWSSRFTMHNLLRQALSSSM